MKKLLFLTVAMFCTLFASAQTTETDLGEGYVVGSIGDNWFLSVGVGAEFHAYHDNKTSAFEAPTMMRFSFSAGKWITPFVGLRAGYSYTGLRVKSLSSENSFVKSGATSATGAIHSLSGDVLLNLSALIGGYKERIYDAKIFGGFEVDMACSKGTKLFEYMPYVGLINEFNVSNSFSVNLELAAGLTNGEMYAQRDYIVKVVPFRVSVGLTYYLGQGKSSGSSATGSSQSNARSFQTVTTSTQYTALSSTNVALTNEVSSLKKVNSSLARDVEELSKEAEVLQEQKREAAKNSTSVKVVVAPVALFFNTGSAKVSVADAARLKYIAEIIKTESNTTFLVEGYADSATGSAKRNQELSNQRAAAVCDVLVNKYGVNRAQLEAKGMGATNSVFETMSLNRTVLVKTK